MVISYLKRVVSHVLNFFFLTFPIYISNVGAVGGIVHYPMQSVIDNGASTSNILSGVGKGVASIITKPIGGAFELVAMTGEGILKGTGWITTNKAKFKPMLDEIETGGNSPLKYHWKLINQENEERLLLIIDASQPEANTTLNPVTLVVTTEVSLPFYFIF